MVLVNCRIYCVQGVYYINMIWLLLFLALGLWRINIFTHLQHCLGRMHALLMHERALSVLENDVTNKTFVLGFFDRVVVGHQLTARGKRSPAVVAPEKRNNMCNWIT